MGAKKLRPNRPQKPHACAVCISPYRREIEKLIEAGMEMSKIAKKYSHLIQKSENNTTLIIRRHNHDNHKELIPKQMYGFKQTYGGNAPSLEKDAEKAVDFEVAAQQLLEIGMKGIQFLTPREALKLSTELQKTHLEGKKVKVSESALKLTAAKFFGGFIGGSPIQEGEILNGEHTPLPSEIITEN